VCLYCCIAACATADAQLNGAAAQMRDAHFVEARVTFARLVNDGNPRVRVRAALGAAHASAKLADTPAERRWLERAANEPEVPHLSEEAYFELAEFLRHAGDRPAAMNWYYRAAATAERDQDHREIYEQSTRAITDGP
jgi:hypothetical protein